MAVSVRRFCGECLGSMEVDSSAGTTAPRICADCGAAMVEETISLDPTAIDETPASLALTSEEETPWPYNVAAVAGMPQTIGRFQLRELLGGGGFGQVYRAYDPRLDREVALKVLKDALPTARVMERFFREARAAAQLDHPGVVALHDAGRDSGRCWIAYQYVPGPTLDRLRDFQAIDPRRAVEIARDLAEALDHAHHRGVFHRDLKPANVIIDDAGRPRLTDFGLARRIDFDPKLTHEGTVLGTPAYMSPEQAAGRSHEADPRSDLYSLGVIFSELLGSYPMSSQPAWRGRLVDPRRSSRSRNRSIPRALDRICRRALAPHPEDRYPDAHALAADLNRWLDRTRPGGMAATLIVSGLVALMIGLPIAGWLTDRDERTPIARSSAMNRDLHASPSLSRGSGQGEKP